MDSHGNRSRRCHLKGMFLIVATVLIQQCSFYIMVNRDAQIAAIKAIRGPAVVSSFGLKMNSSVMVLQPLSPFDVEIEASSIDDVYRMTWWGENEVCRTLKKHRHEHVLVNLTIPSCSELFTNHRLGTGNWIWLLSGLRLAARAHGNTDLEIRCLDDSQEIRKTMILPWIMGRFPSGNTNDDLLNRVCKGHMKCPVDELLPELRDQLRHMALSLLPAPSWLNIREGVGALEPIGSSKIRLSSDAVTKLRNIELDEVAVHFRCGDLIKSRHRGYALHKFGLWSQHISNGTNSIGIITQPIKIKTNNSHTGMSLQARKRDSLESYPDYDGNDDDGCDALLQTLVEYLKQRFPSARVKLRNEPTETIALAYSRMILAKEAIVAGWSTFGIYAALASFGAAGAVRPNYKGSPNQWLNNEQFLSAMAVESSPTFTLWDDKRALLAPQAYRLWFEQHNRSELLQWLVEEDFRIPLQRYG